MTDKVNNKEGVELNEEIISEVSDEGSMEEKRSKELRAQAAAALSAALEVPVPPDKNINRDELDAWDSLKHLELIMLIEEKFRIRLTIGQAAELNSLDDMIKLIEEMTQGE